MVLQDLVAWRDARLDRADLSYWRTVNGEEYGTKARAGLLLHTGRMLEWLAPNVLAAPWWKVL